MKNKKTLTLSEIKHKLKDKRLYYVAKQIGISYPTLSKLLKSEEGSNFNTNTLNKVSQYLTSSSS